MALFESYDRRINQINAELAKHGISSIEEAKEICDKAGVDVGGIPDMKTSVKKVYFNETPADIIKDILFQFFYVMIV